MSGWLEQEGEVAVENELLIAKAPPLYRVILLNDDYTPMDFVVMVIQKFFFVSSEKAHQMMLEAHLKGSVVCGLYPKDVAETKVNQVMIFVQENEHLLQCIMEEAE